MDPELESELTTESISDASGLTPEQLAEVPDIYGGNDDLPSSAKPPAATAATPTQPQAQAITPGQPQTIREAALAYGLDLSAHADDQAAFVALVNQARQAQAAQYALQAAQQNQYYTQLGQQLAPRLNDIQGFLRQQAQPAPKPEAPKPYTPPEFDERWLNLVERDEATGIFKARPGVNPEYADKVQKYADWMQTFNRNPMALISQAIQDEARKIATDVYTQQHTQFQTQQAVQGIVESNSNWIYQTDQYGRRYVDQSGAYIPTPEGARYAQHVQTLVQAGVRDPRVQDMLARQLVQGELNVASATRQQQIAAAQSPQARAAQARPPVNPGQAVAPTRQKVVAGATQPDQSSMSLAEMLRLSMAEEGVTDADFNPL